MCKKCGNDIFCYCGQQTQNAAKGSKSDSNGLLNRPETVMQITDYQRELMKHTVGEPGRNWFGTDAEGKDGQEFEKLVDAGLATKQKGPSWMGGETIYRLTNEGCEAI